VTGQGHFILVTMIDAIPQLMLLLDLWEQRVKSQYMAEAALLFFLLFGIGYVKETFRGIL